MKTWEDIFDFKNTGINPHKKIIDHLEKAEKKGLVCINPPKKEELQELWYKWIREKNEKTSTFIDVVYSRLREGVKE